jgi:beta-glucanase (GH16 family)
MKPIQLCKSVLACIVILSSCKKENAEQKTETAPAEKTQSVAAAAAQTYQLVWSDEFNGTSVNTANWVFETGAGGWGNAEQQYYRSQNATVSNGNLVITAKRESFGGAAYTSARMKTQGKKTFTYGKMEARIKLPLGQGLWPAFWMLGSNIGSVGWPKCGEIDVMEHINATNTVYGTIHWDNNGHAQYGGNTNTTPASYHVYSIEWTPSSIKWFVDGVQYHEANILNSINGTDEFHRPFFFLLNMAVGGNWPGQTIDNSKLPASMYVDYVRVYQLR